MLYVQLDANWPDNPKLIRAGLDGAGLHAVAMCVAKRLDTDGWIDELLLYRYGANEELIGRLIHLGLFEQGECSRIRVHDWLDRNPSQAAIAAKRATKANAAKAGNHRRWNHEGEVESCPLCNPKPQVVAGSDPTGVAPDRTCSPVGSPYPESESESEPASAIGPATTPNTRKARLAAAAEIIGKRAAQRPGTRNPAGTSAAVARAVIRDRHHDAYAHLAVDPTLTAAALAELLEPNGTVVAIRPPLPPTSAPEDIADLEPPAPLRIAPEHLDTARTALAQINRQIHPTGDDAA